VLKLLLYSDIFVVAKMASVMHKEQEALVAHKETWGEYCLLGLRAERIAKEAHPGQFIMVRPGHSLHPLLRRPISIHSVQNGVVEIFFQKSGIGTELMSQKEQGDFLDIIGPLGKGFRLDDSLRGKNVALIGGGRGIAPLYFLAHKLRIIQANPCIFYGGKTFDDIPLEQKFSADNYEILLSTDDGSSGFKGFVTDLFRNSLQKSLPSRIFACGPEAMMHKIFQIAQEKNIPAEFSLEAIMGCGFGACWGCVRKIKINSKEEWLKICEEGPVFGGDQIVWLEGQP
jgi:dihydroorotate dehydrogenase electron transfer subunit